MKVFKRDGSSEAVYFDKISARIRKLAGSLSTKLAVVDVARITTMVVAGMHDGIATSKIDELAAEACVSLLSEHPEYGALAVRILMSNWQKNTSDDVLQTYERLESILDPDFMQTVRLHASEFQAMVDYKKDYDFDYFAIKTLEKIYCLKCKDGTLVERPQHMYLRVAIALHGNDFKKVKETYKLLSQHKFTHASPTLFNAGLKVQQLASCFLSGTYDSLDDITKSWKQIANISKLGGGIGTHVHSIRSKGAPITSTNGSSDGLIPMLRCVNSIVQYINQSGKRKGSLAAYLSPHHPDVMQFLELRRPGGDDMLRCRDIFLAMWVPDLFMKRVEADADWSFFDPFLAPGLDDVWGEAYEQLYTRYEADGKAKATVKAREVWTAIMRSQIETGTPYMLSADACNAKSNQQHLGTIKSSNLCVAPETMLTVRSFSSDGSEQVFPVEIQTLKDKAVDVWNGKEWSSVTVRQTSAKADLIRVSVWCDTTKRQQILECTPHHKFYVKGRVFGYREVEAMNLMIGDALQPWKDPVTRRVIKQRVISVEYRSRESATYCFTEPKRHRAVFNGIMTGQCSEIIEYTSPEEISVCTLASISLPAFVKPNGTYDFAELAKVTKVVTRNLDKVIDINVYPVAEATVSNFKHRPVGIGVQGLADTYVLLRMPFDSQDARELNTKIFATMYYAALEASAELAAEHGPHPSFAGCPASQGRLQFDLWGVEPHADYDWQGLKAKIQKHGLRNSLLIAQMPTASTSQLLGNNESIEPFTSLLFARRTLAGEFVLINRYLVDDLMQQGLWTPEMKDAIVANNGSIQNIHEIPASLRELYKTAWDMSMKAVIDQSADRGPYVCQSQSLNLFMATPTPEKLTSALFYGWKRGLKTLSYYIRSKPASQAKKITLTNTGVQKKNECADESKCLMCSG
jgi:ribonucleotide reductase alpha subunit